MTASKQPILIVNADDYGWDAEATDLTIGTFEAGRISSATAMMYMADDERAAERALEAGLPAGLHVNFTDPFTATAIPEGVRERHQRASAHFAPPLRRRRAWLPDVRVRRDVEAAVADQVERFEALYGAAPTHLDGHNHVHACPDVAAARPLTRIPKRRNILWAWPSSRSPMALARGVRRALTYRGFLTTRLFRDICELFVGDGLVDRLAAAKGTSVEVMSHPRFPHELELLLSDAWGTIAATGQIGSFADLT